VSSLPDDVHRFLYQHISSVEQLEVLLMTRRSPERSWSAAEMARELYSHPSSITQRFHALLATGAVRETAPGRFQYAPGSPELDATMGRLDNMYQERRVAVISLIASKPNESVKAFSDAFRIRRKEE
jgi:hypothetical protein